MDISVLNIKGEDTGKKVDLSESVFGIEPNDHAIYLDVKGILANGRQGTAKAKQRAEISRTTKKLKRQKGTGGARAGSMRSPLFVGGGRVFGPTPRDYGIKVNKKTKKLAKISALSYKAKDQAITVVEDFNFEAPKTKSFNEILGKLNLSDKKTLFVLVDYNKALYLSSRNLKGAKVVTISELNTYDILNFNNIVFVESSVSQINELGKK
ncbi:50S ribosomal protein L4 [Luteibaculum oceani]|uniref:Large ribosomal subunit protein uL4 n=1 Tax=Luteibaculum oceani TaxID=1294296 RepID=A0A5C6UYC1_9FLAO|nr:50S ribosomal protein L4 [Luteibaculum oceani]TXC78412.1 50S ribosomal protein L4 [Luteibaculum oceani]